MKHYLWMVLCLLIITQAYAANTTRVFTGSANITIIDPTPTILKVCTPNQKYSMGPGMTTMMRLYVRNDMPDKTVNRVYLDVASDPGFTFNFTPEHLENIAPDEYQYFDVDVTTDPNIPKGNYNVRFLIGTDEYTVGGLEYPVLVRIIPFSTAIFYGMLIIIGVLLIALLVRTVRNTLINRRYARRSSVKQTIAGRRKGVSLKYYKR
jgi:uncharacterized membrane protein